MPGPVSGADREAFIAGWGERARRLRPSTGLPPSLVVAMAINETGWGRSRLAREAHNFFGLKAGKRPGTAGVLAVETWEVVNGEEVRIEQIFRAFHSPEESLLDLARHLRESPRYAAVWACGDDPDAFARAMLAAGYATDPAWIDKLARLRVTYHLDRFDA
jgi:flagellar protein FlgJ